MLKHKLYFALIFSICVSSNFTNDLYSKFHQADYKVEFQRTELMDYNKSVYNLFEVKTFKYNRTLPVVNITLNAKVDMKTELEVAVQFYKFLSNEYRSLPGTNFQVNFCKSLAANLLGSQILYKCGNFTSCQVAKETTYRICNAYPDETRFPSYIPSGEYKFQMDFVFRAKIVTSLCMFTKIYRPVALIRERQKRLLILHFGFNSKDTFKYCF